jgi:hypothetical protein
LPNFLSSQINLSSNPYGQTGKVNKGEEFLVPELTQGKLQILDDHIGFNLIFVTISVSKNMPHFYICDIELFINFIDF